MKHQRQVQLLRETFAHIDAGTQPLADAVMHNPAAVYVDAGHFERERECLFRSGRPVLAALSCDLPQPGDWCAVDLPDAPLLLVRDADGAVRALLNICRHRGSRLVGTPFDPAGPPAVLRGHTPKVLACPYHAWTYGLDGTLLRHANDMDGFAPLHEAMACGQFNLLPLPCAEADGLVVVRPFGSAPLGVADALFGIQTLLAEYGFGAYHFYQEVTRDFQANWKLLMDTFMEGYHIAPLHRDSLAPHFRCYPSVVQFFGPHALFPLPRKSIETQRSRPEAEWSFTRHGSVLFILAPSVVLNVPMDGHLELWEFDPRSVGSTRVRIRFYIPESVHNDAQAERWAKSWQISTSVIFGEDFVQQQQIHTNLASGRLPEVVYGRNEPVLIHFHRSLQGWMTRNDAVAHLGAR